jgi:hypothetical protein
MDNQPSSYSVAVLFGLGFHDKHVYGGTVDPVTVAKRRARNKVARASRRINRRRAA